MSIEQILVDRGYKIAYDYQGKNTVVSVINTLGQTILSQKLEHSDKIITEWLDEALTDYCVEKVLDSENKVTYHKKHSVAYAKRNRDKINFRNRVNYIIKKHKKEGVTLTLSQAERLVKKKDKKRAERKLERIERKLNNALKRKAD